jgi:hypothetical protein
VHRTFTSQAAASQRNPCQLIVFTNKEEEHKLDAFSVQVFKNREHGRDAFLTGMQATMEFERQVRRKDSE